MRALLDGIRLALRAIIRSPLRASLTVLGILIGVTAVVTVTALADGARKDVGGQIESIGSNFIIVFPVSAQASGKRGAAGSGVRLTDDDAKAILRDSTSVVSVSPNLHALGQAVYGDQNWNTNLVGTDLPYFKVRNWVVAHGSGWEPHDEAIKSKVVIIGTTVAKNLFGADDPVGHTIRIGRYPYRVLGVLESKGEAPFGGDQDDVIIMPITSMRARVLKTPPGFAGVLMASASSPETTDRAVAQITSILRQRHHIDPDRDPDFEIRTQKEFQEMQERIAVILTTLLIVVAAISLIVGGIGVMNIMLVSVSERTREIGIRMAIGARARDIRTQFLVEAVVLSMLGGLAGALLGVVAIKALEAILQWHMAMSGPALAVSIFVTALIGVGFGFFPARRAALLDPIEALRHE